MSVCGAHEAISAMRKFSIRQTFHFSKKNISPFVGPLIPLFCTSGDVSSGVSKPEWAAIFALGGAYMLVLVIVLVKFWRNDTVSAGRLGIF